MRIALLASALVGCFVGIDTTLMDAKRAPPPSGDAGADGGDDPALVGAWSFEETSGATVADVSGHGRDGALVGSVTRVAGVQGQAIAMDGSQRMDVTSLDGPAFPLAGT